MIRRIFKIWSGERLETFVYNEITAEHLHRYSIAQNFVDGRKVLDIACGEGYGSQLLSQKAAHVTGVDVDSNIIKKAARKYKKGTLHFLVGDAANIPCPDNDFDVVVSFETIEHLDDQEAALVEMVRVLRSDGLLILSTPNKDFRQKDAIPDNPYHKKELSSDELKQLLQNKFQQIKILFQYPGYHSLITTASTNPLESYSGNYERVEKETASVPAYLLAVCSNKAIPEINTSLFNSSLLIAEGIKKNITYKVGNIFTGTIREIRNLFNK